MKTFAYCCQSFERATRRAAGVTPVTSPPTVADEFNPKWAQGKDLVYFDLHGAPGEPVWYGDHGIEALQAERLRKCDLSGAVVFAINCYLSDDNSPMLDALLDAGAKYVIGGDGRNYAGQWSLFGAGLLARSFRRWLAVGIDPLNSLAMAKKRLEVALLKDTILNRIDRVEAAEDTLRFRAFYRV